MPRPPDSPWGTFKLLPGDAEVKVEVRKGKPCICPEWPEDCSWLECRSDCAACKRRSAS